jgi:hypothetical protein
MGRHRPVERIRVDKINREERLGSCANEGCSTGSKLALQAFAAFFVELFVTAIRAVAAVLAEVTFEDQKLQQCQANGRMLGLPSGAHREDTRNRPPK